MLQFNVIHFLTYAPLSVFTYSLTYTCTRLPAGADFELSVKSASKADSFGFALLYGVFGYNEHLALGN